MHTTFWFCRILVLHHMQHEQTTVISTHTLLQLTKISIYVTMPPYDDLELQFYLELILFIIIIKSILFRITLSFAYVRPSLSRMALVTLFASVAMRQVEFWRKLI